MAFGLVGTIGAVSGNTSPVTPSFGASENRTQGNLLVCWAQINSNTAPTITAGWELIDSVNYSTVTGSHGAIYIWIKIATGGDTAPTVTLAGQFIYTQVAEFTSQPYSIIVDESAQVAAATVSPAVATAAAPDQLSGGELVLYAGGATFATAVVASNAVTFNNVPSAHSTALATSGAAHYLFGYGVTTGNAAPETAQMTFASPSAAGAGIAFTSLELGPVPVVGAPSVAAGGVGTLYQPVPVIASNGSVLVDTGYGALLGYTVFNSTGAEATYRLHDGVASGTAAPLTAVQSVAASSGDSAWFGPQGVLVGGGIYIERLVGTTEFVVYGQ